MPAGIGRRAGCAAIVWLIIWGFCGATSAQSGRSANDDAALQSYQSGNGLLNRGLYDLAAAEYRAFLKENPDHEKAPIARYGLAVCLYRTGSYEDAEAELETLWNDSRFTYAAEVATMLGQSRSAQEKYAEAVEPFRRVVKRFDGHELADDAGAGLVEAYYFSGDFEKAVRSGRTFLERWRDSPLANRVRFFEASGLMRSEDYSKAAIGFAALLQAEPDGPFTEQAAFFLAQCYHRERSLDQAANGYRKVLDAGAGVFTADALYGLGTILEEQGKLADAGALFDRLLNEYPDSDLRNAGSMQRARVWFDQSEYDRAFASFEPVSTGDGDEKGEAAYWMAKCRLRQGEYSEAVERLDAALKKFPESEHEADMKYDRAVALAQSDKREAAVDALVEFRTRYGDHAMSADALQLLIVTTHRKGDFEQSQGYCEEFNRRFPKHDLIATVAFVSAENDFLLGRDEDAVKGYSRFIERYAADSRVRTARVRLGTALYRLERFEEAERYLAEAPPDDPTFRTSDLALGDIYFQRGEWKESQAHLEKYLASDPAGSSTGPALLQLGLARQRQGEFDAALEAYDRLLKAEAEEPVRHQAMFERGQALVALDRLDEAVAAFEAVLRDAGDSRFAAYAENHLAVIAVRREDFSGAEKRFAEVIDRAPNEEMQADAMFRRGQVLMARQEFDKAEAAFSRLVKEHPSCPYADRARAQLAIALARQDKHDEAVAVVTALEESGGKGLDATLWAPLRYEKAWSLRAAGRTDEAAKAYREILSGDTPGDIRAHAALELAEIEFEARRYEEAASLLRPLPEALRSESSDSTQRVREQAIYRLGVCEFELERYREAGDVLERFIEESPTSELMASASYFCGEAMFRAGRNERAAKHLQRVVQDFAEDRVCGPSMLRLGECEASLQRWAQSERVFGNYLERFGDSEFSYQARFGVGWARENQGRYDEAVTAYERVVADHKGTTAARAQFQIGECLFARNQHEKAVREYLKVDILYAYPEWSAAALYEAGRCFEKLVRPVEARAQFQQVINEYGQTRWAKLAAERLTEVSAGPVPGR